MATHIGIDLGTTNTAIATFDGTTTKIHTDSQYASESTPSAIYMDSNGSTFFGFPAFSKVLDKPQDVAREWKPKLGTQATVSFASAGQTQTPVWCSSKLIEKVFQFVPAALRQTDDISVVITVPAAFGTLSNDATLEAAENAGVKNVKLLAEPVAAVLATMYADPTDKTFLVYDLGGGTFDVSIARAKSGRVEILSQGGIKSDSGRDWDMTLVREIVIPWALENSRATREQLEQPHVLSALAYYIESSKIELSSLVANDPKGSSQVRLYPPAGEFKDKLGIDLNLDIVITQEQAEKLFEKHIAKTIKECKRTLAKNDLKPEDIDCVVFVGGPTMWVPLRSQVTRQLDIPAFEHELDPKTAVARGAAIYAESVKWEAGQAGARSHNHKSDASDDFPLELRFEDRVSSRLVSVNIALDIARFDSAEVEITGPGFTTGRSQITFAKEERLSLLNDGPNVFTVNCYLPGEELTPRTKKITITRAAAVTKMPANRSMFIAVVSKDGKKEVPLYLVKSGDSLPYKGSFTLQATKELKGKTDDALEFLVYDGEISDVVRDNDLVGTIQLPASKLGDIDTIRKGAEVHCNFTMDEGLTLRLTLSVPSIMQTFDNLVMKETPGFDPVADFPSVIDEARDLQKRLAAFGRTNKSPEVEKEIERLTRAIETLKTSTNEDDIQRAREDVRQVKQEFFDKRVQSLPDELLRKINAPVEYFTRDFEGRAKKSAKPEQVKAFDNQHDLAKVAAGESRASDVDIHIEKMWVTIRDIIWSSPWWLKARLEQCAGPLTRNADVKQLGKDGLKLLSAGDEKGAWAKLHAVYDVQRANAGTSIATGLDWKATAN